MRDDALPDTWNDSTQPVAIEPRPVRPSAPMWRARCVPSRSVVEAHGRRRGRRRLPGLERVQRERAAARGRDDARVRPRVLVDDAEAERVAIERERARHVRDAEHRVVDVSAAVPRAARTGVGARRGTLAFVLAFAFAFALVRRRTAIRDLTAC